MKPICESTHQIRRWLENKIVGKYQSERQRDPMDWYYQVEQQKLPEVENLAGLTGAVTTKFSIN